MKSYSELLLKHHAIITNPDAGLYQTTSGRVAINRLRRHTELPEVIGVGTSVRLAGRFEDETLAGRSQVFFPGCRG